MSTTTGSARSRSNALAVVCIFFVFQQSTGINVPLYYGPVLLGGHFESGNSLVVTTTAGVIANCALIEVFPGVAARHRPRLGDGLLRRDLHNRDRVRGALSARDGLSVEQVTEVFEKQAAGKAVSLTAA